MLKSGKPLTSAGGAVTFNKLYRQKRLAAQLEGKPFPNYRQACEKLDAAVTTAHQLGEVADVETFWREVFGAGNETR
jgi:hypothetical protein